MARKDVREQAEQLASQAREAADRGDAASAEHFMTRAVDTNPRDCDARLELSEMLMEHGGLPAATAHLRKIVKQNPDDPRGYVKLARALYLQDDRGGASQLVERALELDPQNEQAWLLQARLERDQGSDTRALAACYRVLATSPDNAEARLLAADIHLQTGNLTQATPLLRSLIDAGLDCPQQRNQAEWLLGRCYALEGRWDDAAAALSAAVHHRESSASDWYQVAYADYRAGDVAAARQAVHQSLRMAPSNAEALKLSRLLDARAARNAGADDLAIGESTQASATRIVPAGAVMTAP